MSNAYLKNAFRMLDALNEDVFDISDEGISQLADTLNAEDNTVNIIDPEAESEEDIQDSYMDKAILECEVCHSLIYKGKDEIKIDEESQLANIDEECPYCFSTNGYKIVGQVAPFEEESEDDDVDIKVDDVEIHVDDDEKDSDEDEDEVNESLKEGFYPVNYDESLEDDWASCDFDFDRDTPSKYEFSNARDAKKAVKIAVENGYIDSWSEGKFVYLEGKKDESLKEGFNDVQITTDDQHLTMTQDSETGKVTVETEPVNQEESFEDEEMMIAPLNDEEEQEIEDNSDKIEAEEEGEEAPEEMETEEDEESEDVDISDFDESLFNNLGQKYLTEVYDNIESFNTSKVYQDSKNNKLIIEGIIKFNSGNSKKTSFIFEAKDIDKDRKVRFVGENQQITKGKKSFTLRGTLKDGNLLSESLTYNYRTRDNDGESIRLYNTIKVDK